MNWRDRFAKQGTYSVGDMAYWDTGKSYGRGFGKAVVVKVTKTMIVVDLDPTAMNNRDKTFRLQPSRGIFLANKGEYSEETLLTPDTALEMETRYERQEALRTSKNIVRGIANSLDGSNHTVKQLEEAIAALQAQVQVLKLLED